MSQEETKRQIALLSVVVPAYNEQGCIGETIDKIRMFMDAKPFGYEIIVVDDGSSDRTAEIVSDLCDRNPDTKLLSNSSNMGKGAAVRKGVLSAEGDFVMFMDADFSTSIEEFDKFQPYLEDGSPIVIGSRRAPDSQVTRHQPRYRELMGQVFTQLSRLMAAPGIYDFTCGFKCFETSTAKKIFSKQQLNDWSFDAEILHVAHKMEIQIEQLPVTWENHPNTKVRLISSVFASLWGLIRIRTNSLLGKY